MQAMMQAALLAIDDGTEIRSPTTAQIRSAIRRLDGAKVSEVVVECERPDGMAQLIIRCGLANYRGEPLLPKKKTLYYQCEATDDGHVWRSLANLDADDEQELDLWMACEGLGTYPQSWLVSKTTIIQAIALAFAETGKTPDDLSAGCEWRD